MRERGHRKQAEIQQSTTLLVAARSDELETALRSIRLGGEVRIDRARTSRELRRLLVPKDLLPHEVDNSSVKIVVMDDDLDIEEGSFGLMRELMALRPGLKVIWVSDRLDRNREFEARRLGVYYIIPRPLELTLLSRVVTKAVEHETTRIRKTG